MDFPAYHQLSLVAFELLRKLALSIPDSSVDLDRRMWHDANVSQIVQIFVEPEIA